MKLVRIIAILCGIGIAASGIFAAGLFFLQFPVQGGEDYSASAEYFVIESGEALTTIARNLEREGLIRSALLLRIYSQIQETERQFQSGTYALSPQMSMREIHDQIANGDQVHHRITIPEGWSIRRIGERLEEYGIVPLEQFTAAASSPEILARYNIPSESAEGYLYPETYFFSPGSSASHIVSEMIDQFFTVLADVAPEHHQLSTQELHEKIVMASIVEREFVAQDEAPLIASVFYNRLESRMRLESCATVVYVITEEENLPHPSRLFYGDLDRNSEYNTYRNYGLPPAPISNPGYIALNAAFNPADTDYHFFVLQGYDAQQHHFSKDLVEHHKASIYYLKNS